MMFSWILVALPLVVSMLSQLLPLADGIPSPFTKVPPNVLYVRSGQDARMVWDYSVSNRNTEFASYSPAWYYYSNTTKIQVAHEYKWSDPKWQWKIAPTCPDSLKDRISKESTATLVISNVNMTDTGIYECGITFISGLYTHSKVKLFVTVSPQFILKPPSSISVSESSNLAVSCSASGTPAPNVTWVKLPDELILIQKLGRATLIIPRIRRDQNGTYECRASNNPNEDPIFARTLVVVQYSPFITTAPKATQVTQGDTISLLCRANGNPAPTISWSKESGNIKDGHSTSGNTLVIPNAVKSDAGKYICKARNVYEMATHSATASAYVTVKYQPAILSKSQDQTINETHPLRLTCIADGYPVPNITWTKTSGTITPSATTGNVYNIPSVSRSHAGTYTCTASNGIGTDAMASIQVTVQYKAEIDVSKSTKTLDSWNGKHTTLHCSFTGNPAPRVTWYEPSGSKITTHKEKTTHKEDGSYVSELNMTTMAQDHYGKYKCVAANVVGTDKHSVVVKHLFTPDQPTQPHSVSDSKGTEITLFWCVPEVKGDTPVIDYKVEINTNPPREIISKNTFAKVKDLQENTQYKVKIYARNKAGYGDPVSRVIVTQNPENHTTFIIAALSTIMAISFVTNLILIIMMFKTQREQRKLRHTQRARRSYENKTHVEMDSLPEDAPSSTDANIIHPGLQNEVSGKSVVDNTSQYQSLSSATRHSAEARPPQLYEPLVTKAEKPQQSEYASLQINSRSIPEVDNGEDGFENKKQTSMV